MIRRLALAGLLVVLVGAAVELGARAALAVVGDRWPSLDEIRQALGEPGGTRPAATKASPRRAANTLHPYLGFVRSAQVGGDGERRVNGLLVPDPVNELGFFGPSPLAPKPANTARVAVTGGSVAEELYLYGRDALRDTLERAGAFGGRRVEIVSLALAGYKQPQQLAALSYVLVLGAPLDAVINLDGFNEVVLPFTDNLRLKLALSYPFRWTSVATPGLDPETARLVSRIAERTESAERSRAWLAATPLRHSAVVLLAWSAMQRRAYADRARLEVELRDALGSDDRLSPELRGPQVAYANPAALFAEAVGIWERASRQMRAVCAAEDIAYLQAVQPNQYVSGAKSLSPAEVAQAILPAESSTRFAAESGLPLLIERGRRLRDADFPFEDLSLVFANEGEPIFRDGCCHYFLPGYQLVARSLGEALATRLATSSP